MKRLKDTLKIDRPFAIFVEPDYDDEGDGSWNAIIVGHNLDNMTCGPGPTGAVMMAADLLQALTGECVVLGDAIDGQNPECKFEKPCVMVGKIPGFECSRCGQRISDGEHLEDA